jgi:hypothetical protein
MAHFAKIENGIVTQVIVADQEFIDLGVIEGRWIQTSYNTHGGQHPEGRPLRKNYAGIGYIYDEAKDAFYSPPPFPSWILNEETCYWEPPIPMPEGPENFSWNWDEENQAWI